MTHYLIAQLNDGRFGSTAILSSAGMATLHQPVAPGLVADSAYGMGWVVGPTNGVDTIWHNGDDTRNHAIVILVPDRQWGIVLLANAAGYELSLGVDDIAKGVLNLVLGQQPSAPSILQPVMKGVYWGVLLAPLLEVLGIGWGVRQLLHWRKRLAAGEVDWGWVRLAWHLLGPILPNLLVAWIFLWGLPQVTGMPLGGLMRLTPDFGVALVAAGVLGLGWSLARTVWIGLMLRTVQRQPRRGRQTVPANA
jgi:hypothetical protein